MPIHVLDLDGAIVGQSLGREARLVPLQDWGPRIRMASSFGRFRRFAAALPREVEKGPIVSFIGSGDFHHVSLALIERLTQPVNLLVIDNHPDWMRGVPFMHCGTWLYHAARLPHVQHVFHVGGDVDFDNAWRWMAPWPDLRSQKIRVLPARRPYERGAWRRVPHWPVRERPDVASRFADELARFPLYVSVDKDVMPADEAVVNWDSGHLRLEEVIRILEGFLRAAGGRLAGMDTVGDWSPVRMSGWLRRALHLTEHPRLDVDPATATRQNERVNRALLDTLASCCRERFAA